MGDGEGVSSIGKGTCSTGSYSVGDGEGVSSMVKGACSTGS